MEEFLAGLSGFFGEIIDVLLDFLYYVIDFLFGWIYLPQMDSVLDIYINRFIDLIFGNSGLLFFFVRPLTVRILLGLFIAVVSFKYLYKVVMWFVRKLPFINIK